MQPEVDIFAQREAEGINTDWELQQMFNTEKTLVERYYTLQINF